MRQFLCVSVFAALLAVQSGLLFTAAYDQAGPSSEAPDRDAVLDDKRAQAETALKQTFSQFRFLSFEPSSIPGLYQIDTGDRLIYYSDEAMAFIFGTVWNRFGVNLTAEAMSAAVVERMKDFDYSLALEFGPPDAPLLTEYSNPHCAYCQELHAWLREQERTGERIRRRVIFAVGHSLQAQKAAEHILCSDDPEAAYHAVYSRRQPDLLQQCEKGRAAVLAHIDMTRDAGISGTPTLFADGQFIRGFDQRAISDFLQNANFGE
ncbi:DsbC family protein [Eilatimonas milleporae]|uniref:Thiol:disulfide interchange protein n=1 Tax=Eilatimonas milleporae TaxID=911205 RepID=A0A3M0CDG5_9PROT|nr:DsbC family protein [Eilatimonas milleporae]RMB05039.1 thiol:disulfide interchange protein DsbC [Eilatimonas milleporae]